MKASENFRLMWSASLSYEKHFADPLAAAEGDALGEALDVLRGFVASANVFDAGEFISDIKAARALLAKTKVP